MSVEVTFYTNKSTPNTIDKNITHPTNSESSFRDPIDIVNPVFTVTDFDRILTPDDDTGCNYFSIFDNYYRYYFITDVVILGNRHYEIHGHEDVLMTFKSLILNFGNGVIKTTDTLGLYANGGSLIPTCRTLTSVTAFGTGFNPDNPTYILLTAGGNGGK